MKIATVRDFALGLKDVTEEPHHHFSSFRCKGKIFVTVPPDEEHIHVFVGETKREVALALYPAFVEKLLWGGKVVGLRIGLVKAKASAVKSLVLAAYEHRLQQAPDARKRESSSRSKPRSASNGA